MARINIFEHQLADLFFDEEMHLFEEIWKPATQKATDQDYINYQKEKLAIAGKYHIRFFLCDTQNFFYTIVPEMQTWTDEVVMGFWNNSPLEKLAFIMSTGFFEQIALEQAMEENTHKFPIQYFPTVSEAMQWLQK